MRISKKRRVTVPQRVLDKLRIKPETDVEFVVEGGRAYLVRASEAGPAKGPFRKLRGTATVKMATDEIMALTRGR
jgi:bifunctional DNA-binding transcriptional regulator/antitoxin component of YhaV-PrlF toxin-antitoxin module